MSGITTYQNKMPFPLTCCTTDKCLIPFLTYRTTLKDILATSVNVWMVKPAQFFKVWRHYTKVFLAKAGSDSERETAWLLFSLSIIALKKFDKKNFLKSKVLTDSFHSIRQSPNSSADLHTSKKYIYSCYSLFANAMNVVIDIFKLAVWGCPFVLSVFLYNPQIWTNRHET